MTLVLLGPLVSAALGGGGQGPSRLAGAQPVPWGLPPPTSTSPGLSSLQSWGPDGERTCAAPLSPGCNRCPVLSAAAKHPASKGSGGTLCLLTGAPHQILKLEDEDRCLGTAEPSAWLQPMTVAILGLQIPGRGRCNQDDCVSRLGWLIPVHRLAVTSGASTWSPKHLPVGYRAQEGPGKPG